MVIKVNEKTFVEPAVRINMKQTAKGKWYGELTARAETISEVYALAKDLQKKVEELSTVGDE